MTNRIATAGVPYCLVRRRDKIEVYRVQADGLEIFVGYLHSLDTAARKVLAPLLACEALTP